MKKPLILIVGPTAVGKTDISIKIAKKINCEIISADSMQIYKYMNIGTAKPTQEEMQGIHHYLMNEVEPNEEFNVALFQKRALQCIEDIYNRNKLPLVVGGTGLYVNSLVFPWDFTESISNWDYRKELNDVAEKHGNEYIHGLLSKVDPISAESIHPNNRTRVIRALEVYKETGKTMSFYKEKSKDIKLPYPLTMIGLTMDRALLYERINQRIDLMLKDGLVNEVDNLLKKGYHKDLISMQGLGYKEIVKYIEGEYTLEEATFILKRDTRRFAKRQLTWFRRDERIKWFRVDEYSSKDLVTNDIIEEIYNKI